MPNYDYQCQQGHKFTKHFATFAEGRPFIDAHTCTVCSNQAPRVLTAPTFHFLGEGWTNPVPSGRPSTRVADPTKVAAEVAKEFGPQNLAGNIPRPQVQSAG